MALTSCDSLAIREEALKLKRRKKEKYNVVHRCSVVVLAFYIVTLDIFGLLGGSELRSFFTKVFSL